MAGALLLPLATLASNTFAQSESKRLVVASPTGDVKEVIQHEFAAWEKENNVTVEWVPLVSTDALARAVATKDNPEFDVVFGNDDTHFAGAERGLWAPLDKTNFTNLDDLSPLGVDTGDGVAYNFMYTLMFYRPEEFTKLGWAPPKSFDDLFSKEYCGRVGMFHVANTYGMQMMLSLADLDPNKMNEAIEKITAYRDCLPTLEKSPSTMQEKIQLGEYLTGVVGLGRGMTAISKGVPIKLIRPEDKIAISYSTAAAVRNDAHPEKVKLAQKFIDWLIGPQVQKALVTDLYYGSPNEKVEVPADLAAQGVPTAADVREMVAMPLEAIAKERPGWSRELDKGMMR